MTDEERIAAKALELLTEQGLDERDTAGRDGYPEYAIRKAVTGIAGGGERAALAQLIGMVAASPAAVGRLTAQCMEIIQQARHAAFAGNTGWEWDEDDRQWAAWRGGAKIVARYPRDRMPPLRADWLGIQLTGESWHGVVARGRMENPGEKALPWNRPVLAEIPVRPGTEDWYTGLRGRVYLGMLCSPCGRTDSRVCLQPQTVLQSSETQCVPVDPDHVRLIVLDGKLADYA